MYPYYVAQAINKHTGEFKTCTHCGENKELAMREAKYYRSIGYNAKVFDSYETYVAALDANYEMVKRNSKMMKEAMGI
jgi:hypothetical protein